jgi:hypothetical protein
MLSLTCFWTGRPKKKHVSEYRQWILHVQQQLADRWQERLLYALGVARERTEVWTFEPDQLPKLAWILPIGL